MTLGDRLNRCVVVFLLALATLVVPLPACRKQGAAFAPYVAFVANNQSNSIAVVDLAAFRVIHSIPVAPGPIEVTVRPRTHEVYVPTSSGGISVIAFPELRVRATLRFGRSPHNLVFSADGSGLYALDSESGDVVFGEGQRGQIPKETGRVHLGGALGSLAVTLDGRTLVVADQAANRLVFLDAQSRQVLGSVEVGTNPGAVAILPDSSKVFVADAGENKISIVDIRSRQVLTHLELAAQPTGLALKPDGGELFVLCGESALVSIVDTFNDNVEQNLPAGHSPVAAVFRRDSTVVYIVNASDGSVTALDIQNRAVLDSTHAGTEPHALALTPDERFLVVADAASASVTILRAVTGAARGSNRGALVTTVPVGARPVAVAVPDWLWQGSPGE